MRYDLFGLAMSAFLLGRAATLLGAGLSIPWLQWLLLVMSAVSAWLFAWSALRHHQRHHRAATQLQPIAQQLARGDVAAIEAVFMHDDDALPGTWRCSLKVLERVSRDTAQPPDA